MRTADSPTLPAPGIEAEVFWERHKWTVVLTVAVIIVGALAYSGFRFYRDRQEAKASELLASAKNSAEYEKVIVQFPRSAAAASACLLEADAQRSEKKFAEANTTLQSFIAKFPKHELVTTAWMGIAANQESLGKSDDALSTYQRVAASYPQSFNAPAALIAQVHLLKEKNRIDEARRVCETVMTQYRQSYISAEASRQLKMLKPATPPAPAASAPKP